MEAVIPQVWHQFIGGPMDGLEIALVGQKVKRYVKVQMVEGARWHLYTVREDGRMYHDSLTVEETE